MVRAIRIFYGPFFWKTFVGPTYEHSFHFRRSPALISERHAGANASYLWSCDVPWQTKGTSGTAVKCRHQSKIRAHRTSPLTESGPLKGKVDPFCGNRPLFCKWTPQEKGPFIWNGPSQSENGPLREIYALFENGPPNLKIDPLIWKWTT